MTTGKAWDVIAYTFNGGVFHEKCLPLSAGDQDTDMPSPVFSSDDAGDLFCEGCNLDI